MELSRLDTRGAAERGRFYQFRNPATGEALWDGETAIGAVIRGVQSRTVQAAITDLWRAQMQGDQDAAKRAPEDLQADMVRSAVIVTETVRGVTIEGEALGPDDFARFYDAQFIDLDVLLGKTDRPGSFAQQAWRFANEDFFPEA
ncbi:MAG: hypothetical protein EBR82_40015 [Caulobacteraceae bacterium]|nr:hypothetical protein [Caulobacteraceae bacterium]